MTRIRLSMLVDRYPAAATYAFGLAAAVVVSLGFWVA